VKKKCLVLFVFTGSPTVGKFNGRCFLDLYTTIEAWFLNYGPFEQSTMNVEDITLFEREEWQLVHYHWSQAMGTHLCP